jgi:hypothetical protein
MNTVPIINDLIHAFKEKSTFSTDDVYRYYSSARPGIKRTTVNWRIYHLIQTGVLRRIGRGRYSLGSEKIFNPLPDKKTKAINLLLKKRFPLIAQCVWRISELKEFFQHYATIDFLLVEVERDAVDSVFYSLREIYKNTFREASKNFISDFLSDLKSAIIVKTLPTESPLQINNGITMPSLEKILVDLYTEKGLFYFIQGNEYLNIFKNAVEKYTVNSDKLLRYANRRGKKEEIQKIMEQNTNLFFNSSNKSSYDFIGHFKT